MREAPALSIVRGLLDAGATVRAFDPVAATAFAGRLAEGSGDTSRFSLVAEKYEALAGADALVLITEWKEFRSPDFRRIREPAEAARDLRWSQPVRRGTVAQRRLDLPRRWPRHGAEMIVWQCFRKAM